MTWGWVKNTNNFQVRAGVYSSAFGKAYDF